MKKILLILLLLVGITAYSIGRTVADVETKLNDLFQQLYQQTTDSAKCHLSNQIADELQKLSAVEAGMASTLSNVAYLKVLKASDSSLNYYSWSFALESYFKFAGLILTKDGDAYELANRTAPFLPESDRVYNQSQWYGAIYYDLVSYTYKKQPYYLLIGWSKYSSQTQVKLVDVLSIENGIVTFGKPLFELDDDRIQHRYILDYDSKVVANILVESNSRIVFDHLSPLKQVNIYSDETSTLGPDMSFDAFQKKGSKWLLKKDVRGKNKKL